MVGDGPLREPCQRLVEELRLPIRFTGFLNQSEIVPAYIAAIVAFARFDLRDGEMDQWGHGLRVEGKGSRVEGRLV